MPFIWDERILFFSQVLIQSNSICMDACLALRARGLVDCTLEVMEHGDRHHNHSCKNSKGFSHMFFPCQHLSRTTCQLPFHLSSQVIKKQIAPKWTVFIFPTICPRHLLQYRTLINFCRYLFVGVLVNKGTLTEVKGLTRSRAWVNAQFKISKEKKARKLKKAVWLPRDPSHLRLQITDFHSVLLFYTYIVTSFYCVS
jgi:hypothetical protein